MQDQQQIPKRPSTFPIFSKHLALQPITVVDYANQCKKHFEDFNEAFKRRITIEHQYARNLEIVSKSLDRYIQPGTEKALSFICSAFKVQNQQRAHQARQLAQSLRTQIYEICSNLYRQQSAVIKRVQKDVKKYLKQFQNLDEILEKASQNYNKVLEDSQQLIITKNFLKHTSQIPQQKKTKLISKTMDSIKQKKEYQKLYLSANRNYNQFVRQYNKTIVEDLNQIQEQIREQIVLQSDCLRKLIVCEVSMFKNIQYDLINISKQMEALDTQKDVEILMQEMVNSVENLIIDEDDLKKYMQNQSPKQKRKSVNSDILSTISAEEEPMKYLRQKASQVDKGMMSVSLKQVQQQIFSAKLLNRKNKNFKELIQKRWQELQIIYQNANNKQKPQQVIKQSQASLEATQNSTQQTKNSEIATVQNNIQSKQKQKQKVPSEQQQKGIASTDLRQVFNTYFIGSQISKQLLGKKKQDEKTDTLNQIYQNFIIITRYIHQIWTGAPPTLIEAAGTKKKKSIIEGQLPLNYIKKVLPLSHFYRMVAYSYIQSFRIHHKVMIENGQRAKEICKFISALLTKSTKQSDVVVLKGLLGLLFTFYWADSNVKKNLFIDLSIYKNSLWKKDDFWKAAIFQSTYQEMLSFGAQKGQSFQQTILREKNLIFSQLASYCHYMVMLGINNKSVRQIVGRYCRLYQMNQDQNKDLSRMITNTVKQFKEVAALYKEAKVENQITQKE